MQKLELLMQERSQAGAWERVERLWMQKLELLMQERSQAGAWERVEVAEAGASDTVAFPSRTDWVKWTILRYFLYFYPTLRVKMPYSMGKTGNI